MKKIPTDARRRFSRWALAALGLLICASGRTDDALAAFLPSRERLLIPGGQSIGVAIETRGVLVVGTSDLSGLTPSPARSAGLRAGDRILEVDGEALTDAKRLAALAQSGKPLTLTCVRGDASLRVEVRPRLDERDGQYRLGAWVRDSTAGVGTLSFCDPESLTYGALGHAIADVDTGAVLSVREGEIRLGSISGIRVGESGSPGELVGELGETAIGNVEANSPLGLYGTLYAPVPGSLYPEGLPIMSREEVRLGEAQLLTTLDDEGVRAYDCEIVKLNGQSAPAARGLVIRVTDQELLARTGGIVQGMSGSPILQNGRIVGAVTHVFVNDPTQGFGVYIEWMLSEADALGEAA